MSIVKFCAREFKMCFHKDLRNIGVSIKSVIAVFSKSLGFGKRRSIVSSKKRFSQTSS